MITTQKQLRAEFWADNPQFKRVPGYTQNQYAADIRMAFCDYIEHADISQSLKNRATL